VVFRFCGVPPSAAQRCPHQPGQISRDHSYPVLPPGNGSNFPIYSLVAESGPHFVRFAEQVSNRFLRVLGRREFAIRRTFQWRRQGLPQVAGSTGLPQERLATLLERYGTGADKVAAYLQAGRMRRSPATRLFPPGDRIHSLNERLVHLDDLILRRL